MPKDQKDDDRRDDDGFKPRGRVTSSGGVDVLLGMSAVEMAFGTNAEG